MAHLLRLILLMLALAAPSAWAACSYDNWIGNSGGWVGCSYQQTMDGCESWWKPANAAYGGVCCDVPAEKKVAGRYGSCSGGTNMSRSYVVPTCTAPKVLSANKSSCVCPDGLIEQGGACVKDCSSTAPQGTSQEAITVSASSCPSTVAIDGCMYTGGDCMCINGSCATWGPFNPTGEPAATGNPGPAAPEQAQCQSPNCPVVLNGVTVCQICTGLEGWRDTNPPKVVETTAPDGTKTRETEETTTTCTGASCTKTTKKTKQPLDGTGQPTGTPESTTTTTTTSKTDVCASNPQILGCGGSSFSGTCSGGFNCSGDAVLCAIARIEYDNNCKLNAASETSATGQAARQTTPGQATGVSSETIDVAARLETAMGSRFLTPNCIPPQQFDVAGRRYTIDTTAFCNFASIAGYIFVAVASLVAIRMIGS